MNIHSCCFSPFIIGVKDVANDRLKPAMQGTGSILDSALTSPSVEAMVITSFFGSLVDPSHGWRPKHTCTSASRAPQFSKYIPLNLYSTAG